MTSTTEHTKWDSEPVIGEPASYTREGPGWRATGSGTYLGVALDEEDGIPYHYLINGEINGHPQASHGFAAEPGTPTTTDLTPTLLITTALRGDGVEPRSPADTTGCRGTAAESGTDGERARASDDWPVADAGAAGRDELDCAAVSVGADGSGAGERALPAPRERDSRTG